MLSRRGVERPERSVTAQECFWWSGRMPWVCLEEREEGVACITEKEAQEVIELGLWELVED